MDSGWRRSDSTDGLYSPSFSSTPESSSSSDSREFDSADQAKNSYEATRARIASIAESYVGSQAWSDSATNGRFLSGKNKCNLFVDQVLTAAGVSPEQPNGYLHPNPLTPAQWADVDYNIPHWHILTQDEQPEAGDVIAQKLYYTDADGHVMFVGPNNTVIGTGDGGNGPPGTIEQIPMPRKLGSHPESDIVVRRYRSDE